MCFSAHYIFSSCKVTGYSWDYIDFVRAMSHMSHYIVLSFVSFKNYLFEYFGEVVPWAEQTNNIKCSEEEKVRFLWNFF